METPVNVCDLNPIMELFHLLHTGYNKETTFIKITPRKKDRSDSPIRAAVVVVEERHSVKSIEGQPERIETEKVYATGKDYNDACSTLLDDLKKQARHKIRSKTDELEREKEKLSAFI